VIYVTSVDHQLWRYEMDRPVVDWKIRVVGGIDIGPSYSWSRDQVYLMEERGYLLSATGEKKVQVFAKDLGAGPVGGLVLSGDALYIATENERLHVLDARTGQERWTRRLRSRPDRGPAVTQRAVYQFVHDYGVYRFDLQEPQKGMWHLESAKSLLAEWPDRTVFLLEDGRIGLVRPDSGEITARVHYGQVHRSVINTRNDAVFLVSPDGAIRCIRPAGARPLTVADFRPVSPATTEAEDERPGESIEEERDVEEPEETSSPSPRGSEDVLEDPLRNRGPFPG
jgi:hypothetical protein